MSTRIKQDNPRGWAVVFAAFMTHLISHGIVYSYGILFISFEEVFHGTKAELAWIASITTGSLYLSGPLASILLRRHGSRIVALCGGILSACGCALTVFAPNLYFMYFSLGFLTGVGYGLIFIPAVVEVTIYFRKHRALACGVAVSGAGAGAFIFSPLIEYLLDIYAWRGTLLICSGLILNCVPCSLIFRNKFTTGQMNHKKHITYPQLRNIEIDVTVEYGKCDDKFDLMTSSNAIIKEKNTQEDTHLKHTTVDEDDINDTDRVFDNTHEASAADKMISDIDQSNSSNKRNNAKFSFHNNNVNTAFFACCKISKCSMFQVFQQKEMTLFYCSQILFMLGFYFPFIGIPDLAIQRGMKERDAVWIISTCGISTVAGRVLLGYLSDRPCMNSLLLYKVALLAAGISTSLVPVLLSYAALIMYAITYGLSTAVMLSQTTVILVEIIGLERMSDAMGLNNMFSGIGALLGPPILGLLYDRTASYTYPFVVSGLSMTIGAVLLFLMKLCTIKCS